MKWLTSLSNIFIKEVIWLKINQWAVNLFWCSIYFDDWFICTTRFKNLRYNSVCKLFTAFPANGFPVFLIKKPFILDAKGFLDSPLHAIHCDIVKHKLHIASYELLVTNSKFKSTRWNSNVRVKIHELQVQFHEFKFTSYEFNFTSYEFKSTSY